MLSASVRVRLFVAGMTIGILTLVLDDGSGAVEAVVGNLAVVFGDSWPPVNGEVTRGSGEKDIVQPRSTKIRGWAYTNPMYLKKQVLATRQAKG